MTYETDENRSIDISRISAALAEHVKALTTLTEQVHDTHSTFVLNNLEPRLRCGLVRVAVIGITGHGKSTLVNALTEQLILPENPSISSPIPVWIGYRDGETDTVEIYLNENDEIKRENCDLLTFRKKYCYNLRDIMDRDRTRYNNTEFAAAAVQADVLRGNVTLIDTLGISANSVDSRKTIRVLEEGVDAVIFVTRNHQLSEEEIPFIYRYILGCSDDPQSCKKPILPQNLFFVHNAFNGYPSKIAFDERVRIMFAESGLQLSDAEIDEFVKNNIFFVNAYAARLGKLGVYPYRESAPEGSGEEELQCLAELEEDEQWELDGSSREELIAASGMDTLKDAICALGRRLGQGVGETNVSAKRVRNLLSIVDGIIQSANQRITAQNITIAELMTQKAAFDNIEKNDQNTKKQIRTAFQKLGTDYETGFRKLMAFIKDATLKPVCEGYADLRAMPDQFRNDYANIKAMNAQDRANYLEKYILNTVIRDIYENCGTALIRELDERKTSDFKTPFVVLAETKTCMDDQAIILNNIIKQLKENGGDALGMFFPQPLVVDSLIENLKLDLEMKIKAIIADACRLSGQNYTDKHRQVLENCKLTLLQSIIGIFLPENRPQMLWNQIKETILRPLAAAIANDMPGYAEQQILAQTIFAFTAAGTAICDRHVELFTSLKIALNELENQIKQAGQNAAITDTEMTELKEKCEGIRDDIMHILVTLTSGGAA